MEKACGSSLIGGRFCKPFFFFFLVRDVTILLQLEISVANISESAEILLNLQTKCNEYFHVTKHL